MRWLYAETRVLLLHANRHKQEIESFSFPFVHANDERRSKSHGSFRMRHFIGSFMLFCVEKATVLFTFLWHPFLFIGNNNHDNSRGQNDGDNFWYEIFSVWRSMMTPLRKKEDMSLSILRKNIPSCSHSTVCLTTHSLLKWKLWKGQIIDPNHTVLMILNLITYCNQLFYCFSWSKYFAWISALCDCDFTQAGVKDSTPQQRVAKAMP